MAVVGEILTAPEAGWKRYDNTDVNFNKSGLLLNTSDALYGGTSDYQMGTVAFSIIFKFYGSKLRIIGNRNSGYSSDVKIKIDGVTTSFSCHHTSPQSQVILLEKLNLDLGYHEVTISRGSSGFFSFDALDIDDEGHLARLVGTQLLQPDEGWKRYDDTHPAIKYGSGWTTGNSGGAYGGSRKSTATVGDKASFKFTGTKVRILSFVHTSFSNAVRITIDGDSELISQNGAAKETVLVYEKSGLSAGIHTVVIESTTVALTGLDAIDVDSTERLLHPDEVLEVSDLVVGKRIRCHYQASANKVGVFSGYGLETSEFIPPTSTATPDGDFYLICVDEINGDKKLIADRNIQHSISWDELNSSGVASGLEIGAGTSRTFKMYLVNGVNPAEGSILSTKVSVKKPYRINSIRIEY